MAFIQTNTDKAYRHQQREADRRWENEQREDAEIRQSEQDARQLERTAEYLDYLRKDEEKSRNS